MFETRESDGETVISSAGCLIALLFLPLWLPIVALMTLYDKVFGSSPKNAVSDLPSVDGLSEETVRRRQKRFIKKLEAPAHSFWEIDVQYTTVEIPKRSGGSRELSIPSDALKSMQKRLAKAFEKELGQKVHKTANAYIRGRNTLTNAIPHLGCAVLIKLDVKDFFPSVTREMLEPYLLRFVFHEPRALERVLDLCMTEKGLPQGAPTSPILSNLVLKKFDIAAYQFANLMGAKYTRYADDLTFSLVEDDPIKARKIVNGVRSMLAEQGFELNEKPNKLKILRGHQAQQVCGITLNSGKPTISKKQRREVRAARHAIENGKPASMSLAAVEGWESYIGHVQRVTPEVA